MCVLAIVLLSQHDTVYSYIVSVAKFDELWLEYIIA